MQSARIVGGEPSDETDDAVVGVAASGDGSIARCTGSLIAPNVVLTALHCVVHTNEDALFTCGPDGTLTSQPPGGVLGGTVDPSTISVRLGAESRTEVDAVGVRVFGSGSTQICRHDIAVVVLDRDLEAPLAMLRLERETPRGEYVYAVGYGVNGTEEIRRFRRNDVRVTDVGSTADREAAGNAAPYTVVTDEGACHGDSGGPIFSQDTGALLGVYSISSGAACDALGVRNIYTQVAPFRSLIEDALEFAGYEALVEAPLPKPEAGVETEPETEEEVDPNDPGSGSREDPTCTCRVPAGAPSAANAWWAVVAVAWLVRRRFRKAA